MHASNTVTEGDDGTHLIHGYFGFVVLNLLTNKLRDFICLNLSHISLFSLKSIVPQVLRFALLAQDLGSGRPLTTPARETRTRWGPRLRSRPLNASTLI